jgi:hypothetical protein
MFWRVGTFAQQTPIDAILDRPPVVLEDLLELEDFAEVALAFGRYLHAFCPLAKHFRACYCSKAAFLHVSMSSQPDACLLAKLTSIDCLGVNFMLLTGGQGIEWSAGSLS